jgi:hypothetical protein
LPGYRGFRTTACLKTDPDLQTRISIEMGEWVRHFVVCEIGRYWEGQWHDLDWKGW